MTTFVDAAYTLDVSSLYPFPIPTRLLIAGESLSHDGLVVLAPWALLGNYSYVDLCLSFGFVTALFLYVYVQFVSSS